MEVLKWGIIGFGAFADVAMAPAITRSEGHELVAVTSRSVRKAKMYAEKYGVPRFYGSERELLADSGINTVYVVTPNHQHCEHTLMAAARGFHILCEKPMARTLEEARRMIETCRSKGIKLMIGNMMRFNPCHGWVRGRIEDGAIGNVTEARATFEYHIALPTSNWRIDPAIGGGGALMDVGIHCIDLLRYLTGAEVDQVSSLVDTGGFGFPADLRSALLLRFETGAFGTVYATFTNSSPLNTLEIRGTRGSILCEGTLWRQSTGKVTLLTDEGTQVFESSPKNPDPYVLQIRHFAECIETGREPLISGEEGFRDLAVCVAAYAAAREGKAVTVEKLA